MDPICKPESSAPREKSLLRRLLDRGILRGAGTASLVGGIVAAPLLLACSCPSWTEWHVRTMPQDLVVTEWDEETCQSICGGNALSCRPARLMRGDESWEPDRGWRSPAPPRAEQSPVVPPETYEEERMTPAGVVVCEVKMVQPCSIGRRPDGLHDACFASHSALGAHLAQVAHLEAAAVVAFVELALELEAHGAPRSLVEAAERAALDEVRHAESMGRLALAFGQAPVVPTATLSAPRTLEEVLLTNRVEGGIDEAYGAVVAGVQASTGPALLRPLMATVAREESQHAALSHQIHEWGASRVSPRTRRSIEESAQEARHRLAASLADEPVAGLGLPSATLSQDLVATL